MLRLISIKCTCILIKNEPSLIEKKNIYIYGFELFWSSIICILSVILLGYVLRLKVLAFLFLLFFMPIRTVAGGAHCNSFLKCYLLTNIIAIFCSEFANLLVVINTNEYIIWCIYLVSLLYIWKYASLSTYYEVENIKRKNRVYSHIILLTEATILAIMRSFLIDSKIYVAITTTVVVAIMIYIQKKGEV